MVADQFSLAWPTSQSAIRHWGGMGWGALSYESQVSVQQSSEQRVPWRNAAVRRPHSVEQIAQRVHRAPGPPTQPGTLGSEVPQRSRPPPGHSWPQAGLSQRPRRGWDPGLPCTCFHFALLKRDSRLKNQMELVALRYFCFFPFLSSFLKYKGLNDQVRKVSSI